MTRNDGKGVCEHCHNTFEYWLCHCGMGECGYAYCDSCGRTAILSEWDKRRPQLRDCPGQREICAAMERYLLPCACGGSFKKGATPRCPHCKRALSPEVATLYIEANAPSAKKGWRWQRNWSSTYCIVVENNTVSDNFLPTAL